MDNQLWIYHLLYHYIFVYKYIFRLFLAFLCCGFDNNVIYNSMWEHLSQLFILLAESLGKSALGRQDSGQLIVSEVSVHGIVL